MTGVDAGVISGVRVTHEDASVDEIASAGTDSQQSDVGWLLDREGVTEAFVVRTCNRAEAYVVTEDADDGRAALDGFVAGVDPDAVVESDHEASLRHLLRVAAGLESMVLGEDRVLGQLRDAYEDARSVGGIGPVLEEGVTKALHVGERIRTETAINEGVVSMGSAAAEHLRESVDIESATGVLIGAGDIGTGVAKALANRNIERLIIANRTAANAEALADAVDAPTETAGLDDLGAALSDADLAVTATGASTPVVDEDTVADAGEIAFVDMGQPRDVDPAVDEVPGVERYDLDALETVTETTREQRRAAAEDAEGIVDREFDNLLEQYKRKRADAVIAAMHESAASIKRHELERALTRMEADDELTDDQREVVAALADSLVNKLLAAPTKSLRDAAAEDDWATIATALQLFDPEFGVEDAPFAEGDDLPAGVGAASGDEE